MNRKGQALVEFILILPVFLMILFTIIDFGNILVTKSRLENVSTDLLLIMKEQDDIDSVLKKYEGVIVTKNTYEDDYYQVKFEQKVTLMNPFLHRILGNPCVIEVERVIPKNE